MHPGDSCRLSLTITVPSQEGEYQCEIDLSHEGVLWFGEKGSPVLRFPVRVGRPQDAGFSLTDELPISQAQTPQRPAASEELPTEMPSLAGEDGGVEDPGPFPMYGVQKEKVIDLVLSQGGELIHVENDRSCGDDWVSYRYFVRNRA